MAQKSDPMWMEKAFKPENKGKLHRALHVPEGKKIPASKLAKATKAGGKMGQMANAAKNANKGRTGRGK